jgi:hypothetical protein
VEITGVSPAASEELTIVVDSSHNATVHNYYESFYANVYGYKETNLVGWISGNNTYEVSTVTLKLTNAGSKFASTTFLIPNPTSGFENTITFTSNNSSKTSDVGGTDNYGGSRRLCGTQKISTVTMTYGGKDFTVKLSDMVTINEGNSALPSLTYTGLEDHSAYVQTPATYTGNEDGRAVKVTLPSLDDWVATYSEGNDTVISNEKTTTSGVCYYTSSGSLKKTYTYYQYNRTTTTWTETAAVDYYTATYRLSGWKIDGKTYAPGTEVTISAAKEAEAVIEIVDRTYVKTESQSRTGTTILDTSAGTSTSTSYWGASLPSGYKTDVGSKDNLYLTAETTYTEWK